MCELGTRGGNSLATINDDYVPGLIILPSLRERGETVIYSQNKI